jgi:hypothetical protein
MVLETRTEHRDLGLMKMLAIGYIWGSVSYELEGLVAIPFSGSCSASSSSSLKSSGYFCSSSLRFSYWNS